MDKSGDKMLISCVVYSHGKKLADIDASDIHKYLDQPDCFVWVALLEPNAVALEQMQHEFGLHPLAVEDARHGHQRPKIEEYGDSLFAVVHMIEENEGLLVVGEVDIFADRNYVLSVRRGVKKGFQDVRARCEQEPHLLRHGSGYVLYALIDAAVDRYFPILESLEAELEAIEEQIFANKAPRENIESLYALKQKFTLIRHAVAPLLDGIGKVSGKHVPPICEGMREYFRDIYDHLQRLNQAIESTRETVATAIAVNLSMISLQENETVKQLAAYAALIAVPTLIAGVYGMNFAYMPELQWRYGYPTCVGLMAVIDVCLYFRFRRAQWL